MRIAGITIPKDKQVHTSLTYVYGIGETTSKHILNQLKIDPNTRTKDLTPDQEDQIRMYISKNYTIEGDLRSQVYSTIKTLRDINSYRGMRHKKRLPVRGQRTKTNARTHKGKKRGTVANKKKVSKK